MLFQKLLYRSTGYIIQWGVTHVATSSTETETVMEVFKNLVIPLFLGHLKLHNQTFFGLSTGQTPSSIPVKIIYEQVIGIFGWQSIQKYEHF